MNRVKDYINMGTKVKLDSKKMRDKVKVGYEIFKKGFVNTLDKEEVYGAALTLGFAQGLKYNGNFKRGVITGVATVATIATVNGIATVIKNRNIIREI